MLHFGAQNLPKMSQHGIQNLWEGAMMAKSNDFENCCFVLFFAGNLEHQASQESPKTAKKPPKLPPNGHQEAVQKMVPFWTPISTQKMTPKGPQICSQTFPKVVQKPALHLANETRGQNKKCCKVWPYLQVQILSQK